MDIQIQIRRPTTLDEIKLIALLNQESFSAHRSDFDKALAWARTHIDAYPREHYYIGIIDKKSVAYILWAERGGFRQEAVWELEQIAVKTELRKKGIGTLLIRQSLKKVSDYLQAEGRGLKSVFVTTGEDKNAVNFYKTALGAYEVGAIPSLYKDGQEIIMKADFNAGIPRGW